MYKIILCSICFLSIIFLEENELKNKNSLKNNKSKTYLDIYKRSYELLNNNYVDSINSDEIIISGIKGLMVPLDPYTKLLEGSS